MSQHDYDVANQAGAGFRSDLNSALAAIVSNNSGASQPATMFAYQFWADTTTGLLKIRNSGNTAWVTIGVLAFTYLGMGPLAERNTWTKAQDVAQVSLTDAANISTDAQFSNVFLVTLAGNRTLDNPTNLVAGQVIVWNIRQDATGSRTMAYGALFKFPGGIAPVLSTLASSKDILTCAYDGAALLCSMQKGFS